MTIPVSHLRKFLRAETTTVRSQASVRVNVVLHIVQFGIGLPAVLTDEKLVRTHRSCIRREDLTKAIVSLLALWAFVSFWRWIGLLKALIVYILVLVNFVFSTDW